MNIRQIALCLILCNALFAEAIYDDALLASFLAEDGNLIEQEDLRKFSLSVSLALSEVFQDEIISDQETKLGREMINAPIAAALVKSYEDNQTNGPHVYLVARALSQVKDYHGEKTALMFWNQLMEAKREMLGGSSSAADVLDLSDSVDPSVYVMALLELAGQRMGIPGLDQTPAEGLATIQKWLDHTRAVLADIYDSPQWAGTEHYARSDAIRLLEAAEVELTERWKQIHLMVRSTPAVIETDADTKKELLNVCRAFGKLIENRDFNSIYDIYNYKGFDREQFVDILTRELESRSKKYGFNISNLLGSGLLRRIENDEAIILHTPEGHLPKGHHVLFPKQDNVHPLLFFIQEGPGGNLKIDTFRPVIVSKFLTRDHDGHFQIIGGS